MKSESMPEFIVVDDDGMHNIVCRKVIERMTGGAAVRTYTEALEGLEYIRSKYTDNSADLTILLLDIDMPVTTGWQALDIFQKFPAIVKDNVRIYMLSSSLDPYDREMADAHPLVAGFIMKALSHDKFKLLFPQYTIENP
ncbi:MAG: response regulator [Taibaiella sp.]|nr:response regulator [Taibaiella sp.]